MNECALDTELGEALAFMAEANWPQAQESLVARYRRISEAGNERLNLFLLSISAASNGKDEAANKIWTRAQAAPLDETTPRYFDLQFTQNDPRQSVLIDLERTWWDFNGWNTVGPVASLALETEEEVDWSFVLEATLAGNCSDLESKFGRGFDHQSAENSLLWNFLALSYLQAGNVRTYDEMAGNAPPRSGSDSVPEALVQALAAKGLQKAVETLTSGRWLTNDTLYQAESLNLDTNDSLSQSEWIAEMENGFALLDLSQPTQASRSFQSTVVRSGDRSFQILSLNALSLSFFKLGDYSQAENVYHEFKTMQEQTPVDPSSEIARRYRLWLESVEAAPADGLPFFSPFGGTSDWSGPEQQEPELDFWQALTNCLSFLSTEQYIAAKRELQTLELRVSPTETSQRYLIALAFLCVAVLSGDHFEVQEFEMELNSLSSQTQFQGDELQQAMDAFRWAGFESLAQRFQEGIDGRPGAIDSWKDITLVKA